MSGYKRMSTPIKVKTNKSQGYHEPKQESYCSSCNKQDSFCNCNFKAPEHKPVQLNSDCTVVNSVVGTKSVQKVAEVTLPITAFAGLDVLDDLVSVDLVPNLDAITMNSRVIKNKVVNIGLLPVTITITLLDGVTLAPLSTTIPFQEHTDLPGACPGDTLNETPLEVEGIFTQPGVPVITGPVVGDLVTGILFKVVLRTNMTVTRQLMQDGQGNLCDLNPNRCDDTTTPPSFTLPTPPNGGGIL